MPVAPGLRAASRGRVIVGTVWTGGAAQPRRGAVAIDDSGRIASIDLGDAAFDYARSQHAARTDLSVLGGETAWIGPGVVDAHVHVVFADPAACLRGGVVALRDLGAPADVASRHRRVATADGGAEVVVAGPVLTVTGGYPANSWGAGQGLCAFADDPRRARDVVRQLASRGVDVIKVALEPGDDDWPTLSRAPLTAVVHAAHDEGLPVVAHALSARMVIRALDCGVDELAHVPTERLPDELIQRIADSGVGVVSTLQAFFSQGAGAAAGANAAALVRAGAVLRYGTDLGNVGTFAGVDPRELDRLAQAGLGRLGALRAATQDSAGAVGMRGATGMLRVAELARLVVLDGDPLREPSVWRVPQAVVVGRHVATAHHR